MAKVMLAVQADAHSVPIGENPSLPQFDGGRENLQQWREDVEALAVDAALSVGDMSDVYAGAADAASLISDMDNLYAGIGNHDVATASAGDKSSEKDAIRALYGMPANYYAVDVDWLRVIVLDSAYDANGVSEASSTGHLPDAQLTWLENELDTIGANYPTLIAVHHTTWPASANTPTYFNADDAAALGALIEGRVNTWVIAGHRHPSARTWDALNGRPVFTIRALVDERWSLVTVTRRCGGLCTIDVAEQVVEP